MQPDPGERPDLLALRTLKLGDLLVAVPALRAIRRAHGEHRIILAAPGWLDPIVRLVDGVDVLLPTPGLNEPLPIVPGSVDVAVNLHGSGGESRAMLERLRARRQVGHRSPGWDGPEWLDGIHERVRWARLVTEHGMPADPGDVAIRVPSILSPAPGAAVIHVGAFYGSREWPVERFARVASALSHDGRRVVVSGGSGDQIRAEEVSRLAGLPAQANLAGTLELDEFAALIAAAEIVVSADTGAAHLASAYAVPSVVIFGPAPVEEWGPPEDGPHIVLTDARLRRGDTFSDQPDPALLAVAASDVIAAARALIG
jgi:ADP-heptose:LPS heptosyltransferase